ncbi:UDP-phosphate galactose phosphotransferase [Deltaproteobacteria bacterium]|nr:UDP-phosphate galactose phosphotransferase [Deltaproteobacteria bacterium]
MALRGDALYLRLKRLLDIALALAAAVVLAPIILLIALGIKLDSPGPVLFRQQRVGQGRRHFQILKFRTMRREAPAAVPTHLLAEPGAFITRSGAFLRRTSLDELPQLLNILKGDMSFVGPRPALYNQDDLIAERDRWGANDVPAGLTGWAQINGRDELPIPVKAALDGDYARRRSLGLDLKIMGLTIFRVFQSKGVREGGPGAPGL